MKDREKCKSYVDDNYCMALTEVLCHTRGKCSFYKRMFARDEIEVKQSV